MPIDRAMTMELADAWFPPFLDAERMSPTHPLREAAFEAAEREVLDSYLGMVGPDYDTSEMLATASDVIEMLRGVASLVALNDRTP